MSLEPVCRFCFGLITFKGAALTGRPGAQGRTNAVMCGPCVFKRRAESCTTLVYPLRTAGPFMALHTQYLYKKEKQMAFNLTDKKHLC